MKSWEPCYNIIHHHETRFHDETVNVDCTWRRSRLTGLNVVSCQVPSECVFGCFVFLTETTSSKPLAACVQRLTLCGSEHFPANFVERVGRTLSNAFAGTTIHSDRTIYTVNSQTDRGLIALLPPYLDALFLPTMNPSDFAEQIYNPRNSKGRQSGGLYKEILSAEQSGRVSLSDIEREIYSPGSPYHHPIHGDSKGLSSTSLADVKNYHRHYYRPSNCFLILAGKVGMDDILQVISSFERDLPAEIREYSLGHPPKLIAPALASPLHQPPLMCFDELELNARQISAAPQTIVRFTSEVLEHDRAKRHAEQVELLGIEPDLPHFNIHMAVQGPDIVNHSDWTAFIFLTGLLRDSLSELNGYHVFDPDFSDRITLSLEERKWPIAIFTFRAVPVTEIHLYDTPYKNLIQRFSTRGDSISLIDEENREKLLRQAVYNYRDQLSWRAEYDVVMSLAVWVSSCSIDETQARSSFAAALHPALDFAHLRQQSTRWWTQFIRKYFADPVTTFERTRMTLGSAELLFDPHRRSSRWTLSSADSDRGDMCIETLEMRECQWTDKTVEAYIDSIGGRQVLKIDAT